jgi:hypothetical protein
MERKPPSRVLGIPPAHLETERAVVANEDIDAMVAGEAIEGCYDASWHGGSHVTSNDRDDSLAQQQAKRRL